MSFQKTVLGCVAAASVAASSVSADLIINLTNSFGAATDDPPSVFLPTGAMWQLWYSNDTDAGGGETLMSFNDGTNPNGWVNQSTFNQSVGFQDAHTSDFLIAMGTTAAAGGGAVAPLNGGSNIEVVDSIDTDDSSVSDGFFYALFVDIASAGNTGAIDAGDSIGYGVIVASPIGNPGTIGGGPAAPTPGFMNIDGGSTIIVDGSFQATPEPGTFALFALGLATIAWRRRKTA